MSDIIDSRADGTAPMLGDTTPVAAPTRLCPDDIAAEAGKLGCDAPAIWAVCDVESSGGGFLPDGRPKILFEAHIFGRLTRHVFDRTHPNISAPAWNHALYGAGGAHQHDRLDAAIALNRSAALESASWGMFQIMGFNYGRCGFSGVEPFVAAMRSGEPAQLAAFLAFCRSSALERYLAAHDWVRFALGYNGPEEAKNHYHEKLAQAFEQRAAAG